MMNLTHFESLFTKRMQVVCDEHPDPSHDMLHIQRVVKNAYLIAKNENAILEIVVPAAYLHDVIYVAKNDPRRKQASFLSAVEARLFLNQIKFPNQHIEPICHAIETHSFSANNSPATLEAKVVQDADRLDALGAIGIARCFALSGLALRPIYHESDPFCEKRLPNDTTNTLDHFFTKLLKLPQTMQTESGQKEALRRLSTVESYIEALKSEVL